LKKQTPVDLLKLIKLVLSRKTNLQEESIQKIITKKSLKKFVGSINKDLTMYRETSNGNLRKKTFSEGNSNLPDLDLDLDCTDNNCLHVVSVNHN
jgi:hypothetical protein